MSNNSESQHQQILEQGTSRNQGQTAQRMNILAAKLVGETVRTTLGPQGMDKMIVDALGEVVITNDGATILKEMNIEHPTAKMVVEIAKTQEEEVGDGTTTAVVLAGELINQAERLLEQNVHPTSVIKGFQKASVESQKKLHEIAKKITTKDTAILEKLSMTAMTGKVAEQAKEHLSKIVVCAIKQVSKNNKENKNISTETISIQKKIGANVDQSELISGLVLDKQKIHNNMPSQIKEAKIALIDSPLELQQTDTDAKISITDPSKLQEFLDMEERMLKKLVDKITSTGANVVFCQKGVDEIVQYLLAQKGVYACRRVKKSDMEKIAQATGANIITTTNDLSSQKLGKAGSVIQEKIGDEYMTFIRDCTKSQTATILVRANTEHIADEITRAIEDSIGNVASAIRAQKIVGGAGATEIELSSHIQKYSQKFSGKEQLAIQGFAKAMEVIPQTLAENAGLDPIDCIADLKSHHEKKRVWAGLDVYTGKIFNAVKAGVVEPLLVKTQAISSASDVAIMILRIDDVIIATPQAPTRQNPQESLDY
ncbi:MAG: thermosome subunit alpha [Candidatus Woesearchaeota archaeon]